MKMKKTKTKAEPAKQTKVAKSRHRPDTASTMDDYCLDRLFDPEELYYVPMEELVKRYKHRDLVPGRVYNLAKKYGTVPESRVRKINAPQMRRANQRIVGNENFYYPPPKVHMCTQPQPLEPEERKALLSERRRNDKTQKEIIENLLGISDNYDTDVDSGSSDDDSDRESRMMTKAEYLKLLNERKKIRQDLNSLDLDVNYLKRKKDLNEMERRLLMKLMFIDKEIQTDPIDVKYSVARITTTPRINYPTPIAMEKIEKFLDENKWRLVDLFKELDKNKDWKVFRKDIAHACKKGRLDLNESALDELVNALGQTKANLINYKALAQGRSSHLSERRSRLRESSLESTQSDYDSDHKKPTTNLKSSSASTASPVKLRQHRSPLKPVKNVPSKQQSIPENEAPPNKDSLASSNLIKSGKSSASSKPGSTFSSESDRRKEPSALDIQSFSSSLTPSPTKSTTLQKQLSNSNSYLKLPEVDTRPTYYPHIVKKTQNGNNVQSASLYRTISASQSVLDAIKASKNLDRSLETNQSIRQKLRVRAEAECDSVIHKLKTVRIVDTKEESRLRRGFRIPPEANLDEFKANLKEVNSTIRQKEIEKTRQKLKRQKMLSKQSFFKFKYD